MEAEPSPVVEAADDEPRPVAADGLHAHLATPEELDDWDAHAVAPVTGHAYQSRAAGEYRAANGWHVWHIAFDDGFRLLALGKGGSVAGGGWAYAPRGPIPEVDPELTAVRARAAADLLAGEGMDAFIVDGETPAASGLSDLLGARGFRQADELQPSRHRMEVRFGPDDAPNSDEKTIFSSFGATTRNLIRQAERHGLVVLRLDAGGGRAESDYEFDGAGLDGFENVDVGDGQRVEAMLDSFSAMVDATAKRRGFTLAGEAAFKDWSKRALAAGHMFYLQAEHPMDGPVAGAAFLRHGDRLTYWLAGDRSELRKTYPGAVRLLVWRAIQVALDERRPSFDLGGVDTPEFRGRPNKGDPTYGMYQFKESFGGRWVELTGAHELTMRPVRRLADRVIGRLAALRR